MKKTNKLISILLVLAMLLSMAPISVFAASVVANGKFGASGSNLTWSLDSDGVLTVSGSGAMEDFASVSKVPWYSKRTNVKTVVIESGVTNIGKDAFYGISALVNATISDTVTSIGNRAFSGSGLTNFEFSDAGNLKTIGNAAFSNTKIKSMVIPDGVTTLGSYIFGYGPIQSVTIPASVTSIGNYFFEETSSLSEVIFLGNKEPETIGDTVFLACSSLAYVSVPADYEGDTFSNMKVAKAVASVAEVNGQGFATLADAISDAQSINGAELKLLSHISIDSGITIESGKFTIDLNGKELFSNGYFLLRIDGADVTIVDSAGGGIFNATNDQGNIVLEVLSGSANISGGTFNSAGYPATVRDGTLKLTGKDFVLNGNWRIGWYGGSIDLSACTADEVRIQARADGLLASAVTLPDGWGLFETDGTPCIDFVKNDIYVAKAGYKVTAYSNLVEGGTVEGAGTYASGATVTLTASAANGYRFVNWMENGEEVSASAVYTFTASKNRELTANFEIIPHTHSFTYSASGDTITAVCANTDGNCPDSEGTLTIYAPADLYADGTTAKEATVENNLVDTSVAIGDITYSTADGSAPKTAGTYIASVTVGGVTASVQFTLLNYAAKVTDKDGNAVGTYKTFAEAVTAASASEGSTLTLLDDITLTETARISSGKFILDLNGKTILNKTDNVLMIYHHANITIKDSREGGTVETGGDYCYGISNLAELTVESGTIKGNGSGISNHGTLTVNGGNFEAYTYGAITNKATAKIYGGVFEGIDRGEGIQNDASGDIYIYGGKISGNTALLNTGTAYISGGEFTGSDYAALNILKGTVEVTGGSFTGTDFSDGYFSGTPYGEWTVDFDSEATFTLKGGEFPNGFVTDETTANAFLAEGYHFRDAEGKIIEVAEDASIISGYAKVSKGADLSEAVITLDETEFTYSGEEHKPTVTVKVGGKALTEGRDYTVSYANNINAGAATVTITAVADSDYSGKATADFTIAKKSVTVTATAPDKVYDGTSDIKVSEIVITFDGIVDGDTVGYTIKEAWYNGINAGENKIVPVVFNVTGDDADNYSFPTGSEYIAPDYFVEATADITAKDISDGFIILGDALTYNGKEQTQTVEKVLATGTAPEVTYTVSGNKATNVGVYLLTVTGTGNFTGEAKIAYEIAVDMNGLDFEKTYPSNVKSTDRERIEYVLNQVENAETDLADAEKRTEWLRIKGECVELLKMIESVADKLERFKTDLAKYDIDTVTSDDKDNLESFQDAIDDFNDFYFDNLTDEQEKETSDIFWAIEKLQIRISEVAKEITRITNAVNGYDEATVKSTDKADIEQLKADIKALTEGQNITDEERADLAELDAKLDALLKKIADTKAEIDRVNETVNAYDDDTVKSTDREAIEQLKDDIQALLDSGNVTEEEIAALEEKLEEAQALTEKIKETEAQLEEIAGIENEYDSEKVTSDDKAAIEDAIAAIEAVNPDNLTDEQREEYDEIKAGFEALLEEIAAAEKSVADIGTELEMFDEERVTIFWEDDIEALKAKIDELLADENMGEAEKAKLGEYKAQCDNLIEIINTPVKYLSLRFFYLLWDCICWKWNGLSKLF